MILKCSCNHKVQDSLYGKGNRVQNKMLERNKYRCTVCKKENIRSGQSNE